MLFVHSLASEFNYDEDDSLYDDEEDEEDFYYDDARAGTITVKYLNICGNKEYNNTTRDKFILLIIIQKLL